MVIGNNMSNNAPINGQFDEMETFNYQLSASAIMANFQIVSNVDSNLDGIPDLLEDIQLTKARPFLGQPVVITGTIEAEQFDMGGRGIAYSNTFSHPTNYYRPTDMFITNCNDLGGGYCLDQTQQGDWAQYTINVLVPQTYVIETRVEGIGINGEFEIKFATNGTMYTNTGALTIPSTSWTIVSAVLPLQSGTNVMTLQMMNNASTGTNVGRFNYISIYPYLPTPNVGTNSTNVALTAGASYATASNNAVAIQTAVNNLGSAGGAVTITSSGTFMIAQANPNESNDAYQNAAISITNSNVQISGMGQTNTTLIAYNRATTVFSFGLNASAHNPQCSNWTLQNMTLEAQPHRAVSNVTSTVYQAGQFFPPGGDGDAGTLTIFYGVYGVAYASDILITSCQFLSADRSITIPWNVSNVMVRECNFIPSGTVDTYGSNNVYTGQTNTTIEVGVLARTGANLNLAVLENTYNANRLITTTNTNTAAPVTLTDLVNCTNNDWIAPDGFVWFQQVGNGFVARNCISNNELEAVQINAGPASVVCNTFYTLVNNNSCCALNGGVGLYGLPGSNIVDSSTTFVGNWVYGERHGDLLFQYTTNGELPSVINISGNWFNLSPVVSVPNNYPGAAASIQFCQSANVIGNTLVTGGHGVLFGFACTNALVMDNDFGAATYRGIGYQATGNSLNAAQIYSNTLGEGASFHVQLTYSNSFGWFLGNNIYSTTNSNSVSLFTDPASSDMHIYQ